MRQSSTCQFLSQNGTPGNIYIIDYRTLRLLGTGASRTSMHIEMTHWWRKVLIWASCRWAKKILAWSSKTIFCITEGATQDTFLLIKIWSWLTCISQAPPRYLSALILQQDSLRPYHWAMESHEERQLHLAQSALDIAWVYPKLNVMQSRHKKGVLQYFCKIARHLETSWRKHMQDRNPSY